MKKCIIMGAGDFFGFPFETENAFLIAADGGMKYFPEGIKPDLIIGDFDSFEGKEGKYREAIGKKDKRENTENTASDIDIFYDAEEAGYLSSAEDTEVSGIAAMVLDPVKNDSDMLAAVRTGLLKGIDEFHLLGGTGGRIDHTISNIQILSFLSEKGKRGYLYTEKQVLTAITDSDMFFPSEYRGYFSAFSLTDHSFGVTEEGFKYTIKDETLKSSLPTGLSNEFTGRKSRISVRKGTLLLVYDIQNAKQ